MNVAGTIILALVLVADGDDGSHQPRKPVEVTMIAAQATLEGHKEPHFDDKTKAIREAVGDLKQFDTYRTIQTKKAEAPFGKDTKLTINERYTLYLRPLSKDAKGRIKCKIKITGKAESKSDDKDREANEKKSARASEKAALECTVLALPEKQFKLAGLRLDKGRLVVVLTLTDPQAS